jgi:Cof subfamily protein (haloacid dehalogenase superfamily)
MPDDSKLIRAVVSDVDGTLLRRDGTIGEATCRAVARITARGVPMILATGRIPSETAGYYRQLGLATPLVCYHGALVLAADQAAAMARRLAAHGDAARAVDPLAEHLLDCTLERPLVEELLEFIFAEHAAAQVLLGLADRYVINRLGELASHWDMSGPSRPEIGPLAAALEQRVYKVCYFSTDLPRVNRVIARAEEFFAGRLVHQQAHAHLAEFLASGVSKASGAEVALRAVGRAWHEVLAVGDYYNDAEMLRRARIGVAMAEAPEAVRAAADHVTAGRDADGVAAALERFV